MALLLCAVALLRHVGQDFAAASVALAVSGIERMRLPLATAVCLGAGMMGLRSARSCCGERL